MRGLLCPGAISGVDSGAIDACLRYTSLNILRLVFRAVLDTLSIDEKVWALAVFGGSGLGDRRLTKRLVGIATRLAY